MSRETPPQDLSYLDEVVAAGLFADRHAAMQEAIRLLKESSEQARTEVPTLTEWSQWLDGFVALHGAPSGGGPADDSREGIYAGRGE